ncbi:MAG TPA: hypothetical protein VNO26_04325 [Candidatus Limnocylindria bacterium]|nr:hypothetical protein [Candidatus Limnocylindria bacterium]
MARAGVVALSGVVLTLALSGRGLGQQRAPDAEAADAAPTSVALDRDRITGQLVGVSTEEALRQIAAATGADVVGTVAESKPVTVKLDDVPVETALQRILGSQSFSLVFEADGGLRRIRLINSAAPRAPGDSRVVSAPAGPITTPAQFMALEVPISTVGPLAERLGTSGKATMGQLFELAARDNDAGTRVAAVDASMTAIERDPNIQSSIDSMLSGIDDQALAMMLQGAAGERASELMSRVLARTRRPEFRQRVVNMLRALREAQKQG